jgi:hypothetical protein
VVKYHKILQFIVFGYVQFDLTLNYMDNLVSYYHEQKSEIVENGLFFYKNSSDELPIAFQIMNWPDHGNGI